MAGITSFRITLAVKNDTVLPEMAARAKDLSVVYDNIANEWVAGNSRKFDKSRGMETFSLEMAPNVWWDYLTYDYRKTNQKEGYKDWIMVRTGMLRKSLPSKCGINKNITPETAVFGEPFSDENKKKVKYNWETRQTIFLDKSDKHMIRRNFQDYFRLGGDYKDILFKEGLAKIAKPNWEDAYMEWQYMEGE